MKLFFLRSLPWLTALFALFAAWWQWTFPLTYPWPLAIFFLWYATSVWLLAWKKISVSSAVEKIAPSFIVLGTIIFGFLMVENTLERWALSIFLAAVAYFILELLFLFVYAPSRYPVSSLSRVNIALAPVAAFFIALSFSGLNIFLHLPFWISLLSFIVLIFCLFLFTAHPSADSVHRWRWGWLGGVIGLHLAFLNILLPVGMVVHGAVAAFLTAFPLRIRRYTYQPRPHASVAWSEGVLAFFLFIVILLTSRWI